MVGKRRMRRRGGEGRVLYLVFFLGRGKVRLGMDAWFPFGFSFDPPFFLIPVLL